MGTKSTVIIAALIIAIGAPVVLAEPALAAPAGIKNVESFIRNIIAVLAGISGLIATVFFVLGGLTYITSSGFPEKLEQAKRTISWSAIGLTIVIGAFVLSNIITSLATEAFGS